MRIFKELSQSPAVWSRVPCLRNQPVETDTYQDGQQQSAQLVTEEKKQPKVQPESLQKITPPWKSMLSADLWLPEVGEDTDHQEYEGTFWALASS